MMNGILQRNFDNLGNGPVIQFASITIANIFNPIIVTILNLIILITTCFLDWSVETCLEQALGGGLLDLVRGESSD